MTDQYLHEFMSDSRFGYGHDSVSQFPVSEAMADYDKICMIANTIEEIEDPYEASRLALTLTKRVKLNNFMKVIFSRSIKEETLADNRYKQIENRVILGVERTNGLDLKCCTPKCTNMAIKKSHSLQKKGVLEAISNKDNRVYQTKITAFSGDEFMQEVGWNNASTFPGFCSECEQRIFSKAERRDAPLNRENLEVLIWRALCYTRFRRAQELQMRGHIVSKTDAYELSAELDDNLVIASSALLFKNRIHSFRMLESWVSSFQNSLGSGKGHHIYAALRVPNLPFVGAGIIPIYYNFDRNRVQPSDRFDLDPQVLAYTTCVINGDTHLIMCAQKRHLKSVRFLMDMVKMDKYLLSAFIPQIIMGSSDTVYFSIDYWDNQASALDKQIVKHAYFMNYSQMVFPAWGAMSGVNVEDIKIL